MGGLGNGVTGGDAKVVLSIFLSDLYFDSIKIFFETLERLNVVVLTTFTNVSNSSTACVALETL